MAEPALQTALLEVIQALSFAREVTRVTEIVRTAARRLTQADGVTFVLKDRDECFYVDEDAIAPLWKGKRFPLEACVSGWVMQHGESTVIPDIYEDPRVPHDAYRPTFVKSLAMVPVRKEQPIAAIGAYWASHHAATAEELAILQTLAESSSLALENVQLWGEMERSNARERAARAQAEELSALKDHFLATVSHELRTPLNVIQGWVWQLRQRDVAPEIMARAVEALDRNIQLQARLVEDLIDTSRAVAGRLDIDDRLVDLTATCRVVVDTMAPSARDKGVAVTFAADGTEPVSIRGDAQRLQQILWNLLSNAIKFTPEGGSVAVSVARSSTQAVVVVRDTGMGISPEFLPFAFDRFRQADSTSTRIHNGLGVGLAIVRELVRLHGGQVHAASDGKDKGTTITIELPLALAADDETSAGAVDARLSAP